MAVSPKGALTAHQLAKKLLEGPDVPVIREYDDVYVVGVTSVVPVLTYRYPQRKHDPDKPNWTYTYRTHPEPGAAEHLDALIME